jgi:hypothetical protein
MLENTWVAERLAPSQEGMNSVELVNLSFILSTCLTNTGKISLTDSVQQSSSWEAAILPAAPYFVKGTDCKAPHYNVPLHRLQANP